MMSLPTTRIFNTRHIVLWRSIWFIVSIPLLLLALYALITYPEYLKQAVPPLGLFNVVPDSDPPTIESPTEGQLALGILPGDRILSVNGESNIMQYAPGGTGRIPDVGEDFVYLVQQPDEEPRELVLQGTQYIHFAITSYGQAGFSFGVTVVLAIVVAFAPVLVFCAAGLFLFWKRSDDWIAILVSMLLFTLGIHLGLNTFGVSFLARNIYLSSLLRLSAPFLWFVVLLIPDGRFRPRVALIGVIAASLGYTLTSLHFVTNLLGNPVTLLESLVPVLDVLSVVVDLTMPLLAIALWRKYRSLQSTTERQQLKWVYLGFSMQFLSIGIISFFSIVQSFGSVELTQLYFMLGMPIERLLAFGLPISLAVATLRYGLWGIDYTINRSLVYGAITILVVLLFFGVSALLQVAFGNTQLPFALIISAVLSGALFRPARNWIQKLVDRYIFRLRFDLVQLNRVQKPASIRNPGKLTGAILDGYEVLGLIGQGGMGEVYEGFLDGQRVAIKTMRTNFETESDFRIRFEREAEAGKSLQHPQIARTLSHGEYEGTPYMIMEYIEGEDLKELLTAEKTLNTEMAKKIIQDICVALDVVHRAGYVHRDLKPSNIMIRGTGSAMLMDFGIIKIKDAQTITGSAAVGTIHYMAPEQIIASRDVDHRADIYALGVVLYQMLVGATPFKGNAAQIMFAHLQKPPPDPRDNTPDIPDVLVDAIRTALAKDPAARFADARTFAAAIS